MKLQFLKGLGVLIFLFSLTSSLEATVIYDESISGDISGSSTEPTFNFTVGENTILGSSIIGDDGLGGSLYDYDTFMFVLPTGSQLNSVVYDFTGVSIVGFIYNAHISYRIENSAVSSEFIQSESIIIRGFFEPGPHPVSPFSGDLPIGEGVYKWNTSGSGWSGTANTTADYISWDYRIDFQVSGGVSNNPPIANDLTADIIKNTGSEITLDASDPDGDSLIYFQETPPLQAAAFLFNFPDPGSATYFSMPGFLGTDDFSFIVNDGQDDSNVALVTIESAGSLENIGDQILTVEDLPEPFGVRIATDPAGGTSPARIRICNFPFPPIHVPAGADFTLQCGSATIEVLSGMITVPVELNGAIVLLLLDAGDFVTIDEQGTIENNDDSVPAEIMINGIPFVIEAGQTLLIDADSDGVPIDSDLCLNTAPDEVVNSDGCSISDLAPCPGPVSGGVWKNHGQYVSAVAHAAKSFITLELISGKEKGLIVSTAARSECGKK